MRNYVIALFYNHSLNIATYGGSKDDQFLLHVENVSDPQSEELPS